MSSRPADSSVSRKPTVHWTVRMNRRNRSWFSAMLLLTVGSHLWLNAYPTYAYLLAAAYFLGYPQVVYFSALYSRDQRQTEMRALWLDGFWLGVCAALLGFPIWISFIFLVAITVNLTVFRGRIGFLQAASSLVAGAVLGVALHGLHFAPDTGWPTTALAILTISSYVLVVAENGFARALMLQQARARLQQNEIELKRQLQEISELKDQLREQANRDALTGLYNRRYYDDTLQRECLRCQREGLPLSVVMLDIDRFKQINDDHGHQAGDEVLKRLASILLSNVRGSDVASRYGGEEFTLLLPGVDAAIAAQRARELCQAYNEQSVVVQGREISSTLSVGIATWPQHGNSPAELLHAADTALYRAKAEGRNRVMLAEA